jgi:hypothetical protein
MFRTGQHLALGGAVALEFIRDDHSGNDRPDLPYARETGAPRDRQGNLIDVPLVPWFRTLALQLVRLLLAECAALCPDGFVRHAHAASQQEFFDITVAETDAMIAPHTRADDPGWKAVISVGMDRWCIHAPSMACCLGLNTLTTPKKSWGVSGALDLNAICTLARHGR